MLKIILTPKQSVQKYGNPYGDDVNLFLMMLNAAYKARKYIDSNYVDPLYLANIDELIRVGIKHLKENEDVRPWQFDRINGYSWKDLTPWEGRMHYKVRG